MTIDILMMLAFSGGVLVGLTFAFAIQKVES